MNDSPEPVREYAERKAPEDCVSHLPSELGDDKRDPCPYERSHKCKNVTSGCARTFFNCRHAKDFTPDENGVINNKKRIGKEQPYKDGR